MTTTDTTRAAAPLPIEDLRSTFLGRVIGPDDPDYDRARTVMYGGVADDRPAVIVKVSSNDDVVRAIELARQTGLELAVRSGGHSAAGHSVVDGGIVLDVSDLKSIDIDVDGRTVWAGSGLTALELAEALDEHDLAVGFGDTGSVGIGGITLGGGVGYLSRKYGLTIDDLIAAEIVTADGAILQVDGDHDPDLFWAIRGGGGNFGVVTRFRYRVHEVGQIVGGFLILPATPDTVAGYIAAAEAAPEELGTIANVMPCPPMPFVPPEHHGKVVIFGILVCVGETAAAERAIAPFRALATPLADLVHPMRYPEIYPPEDPDYHPTAVSRTMFIDHVDRPVAALILDQLDASDATVRAAQLRVLGGAMARVPADATAYAHRASPIMVNIAAFYDGPDDKTRREAWVNDFAQALDQGDHAAYVNFLGNEGVERVHAAYPGATWDRLAAIKARYDPSNLFHRNQNIPPAS